jgi:uncharacterized ferritin-like protein (DUF455 family)
MELSSWAERVVLGARLEDKLCPPPLEASDEARGPVRRPTAPARAPELAIQDRRAVKVPPMSGMHDPAQRARLLHAFANHELQATELFAWAVLAFPDAPRAFRRGLAVIAADEQRHFGLYAERMAELGLEFGALGVTGHFWSRVEAMESPLHFVCAMGLTYEAANLDFAGEAAAAARAAGDLATVAAIEQVHADEIRHVRFGWRWLRALSAPGADPWTTWVDTVPWPLGPSRARGREVDVEARRAAGLDPAFIDRILAAAPGAPSPRPRPAEPGAGGP